MNKKATQNNHGILLDVASNPLFVAFLATVFGLFLLPYTGSFDGPQTIVWIFLFYAVGFTLLSVYTKKQLTKKSVRKLPFIWAGATLAFLAWVTWALLSGMTLTLVYTNLVVLAGAIVGDVFSKTYLDS